MTRVLVVLAAIVVSLLLARGAAAHPAGFTSVNRYLGVVCEGDGRIRIAYVLDFAEMPSVAELALLDADRDGAASVEEQREYLAKRLPPLIAAWVIEVDGERATPTVMNSRLDVLVGEQGLSTVRITAEIAVTTHAPRRSPDGLVRVNVHDLVFSDRTGWREMVADDTDDAVLSEGPKSGAATALAYESGRAAPRVNHAQFVFRLAKRAGPPSGPRTTERRTSFVDRRLAGLSRAMKDASGSATFTALALLTALGLGAAHALSPGHGKTMAAAYLVGQRARPSRAVVFGVTVTIAHTIVVFVIGSLAVTIERGVGSERLLRTLELISAVSVLLLGAVQLSRRWRELASGHGHEHTHVARDWARASDGARSVVAIGAAAGVTPCPSALAILLAAIALQRYLFGLVLVAAFSVGVAATLTAVGVLVVTARGWLDRVPRLQPLTRWLPIVSGVCVVAIGVLLCTAALS